MSDANKELAVRMIDDEGDTEMEDLDPGPAIAANNQTTSNIATSVIQGSSVRIGAGRPVGSSGFGGSGPNKYTEKPEFWKLVEKVGEEMETTQRRGIKISQLKGWGFTVNDNGNVFTSEELRAAKDAAARFVDKILDSTVPSSWLVEVRKLFPSKKLQTQNTVINLWAKYQRIDERELTEAAKQRLRDAINAELDMIIPNRANF